MKSSFGAIGAMAAAATARELEFTENDSTLAFEAAISKIESEFERLSDYLQQSL